MGKVTTPSIRKDKSIWVFLGELAHRLPSENYRVVDHWEADLRAIGVAALNDPDRLVYVCTFGQPAGKFAFECEAAGKDAPYAVTSRGVASSVDEIVLIIAQHLSLAATPQQSMDKKKP